MKDIPAFTTENGIAGLVLREIPYNNRAYVSVVSAENMAAMTEDVIGFCKALGAQELYGYGEAFDKAYPLAETILLMAGPKKPGNTAELKPVGEEDATEFCSLYNHKMRQLKTARRMNLNEAVRLIRDKQAYYVLENGNRIGFGVVKDNIIQSLASTAPAAGEKVVCALGSVIQGDLINMEVAQSNEKALRLYERLGFRCVKVLDRWYKIF